MRPQSSKNIQTEEKNLVAATIIIGKQPEPHFACCLDSIAEAVDFAAVDFNGDNEDNRRALVNSRLYKEGLMRIEESRFTDYASARNRTLAMLPENTGWIFRVDADEVHYPDLLKIVTRQLLPNLKEDVGMLDAYWLCFFHSFYHTRKLERRHDLFIRHHKGMRWEKAVHEQLLGRQGKRVAAPYIFHHYALVKTLEDVMDKEVKYKELVKLNPDVKPYSLNTDIGSWLADHAGELFKYSGNYPTLQVPLLKDLPQPPPWLEEYRNTLDGLLPRCPVQKGGKLRILYRLLPLLLSLKTGEARKAAVKLAVRLKDTLG
ncbi:hypothetical protein IJT93_01690 [bacterium]|nr:hypothetical protein [bacterium]